MMDHGPLSGIRRTSTPTQRRREAAGIERTIDKALADVVAQRKAEAAERIAAYAAKYAPVPFTPEELKAAKAVRIGHSWYKVIRVNAKTVTVPSGYSWNDRFGIDKVLEVHL